MKILEILSSQLNGTVKNFFLENYWSLQKTLVILQVLGGGEGGRDRRNRENIGRTTLKLPRETSVDYYYDSSL